MALSDEERLRMLEHTRLQASIRGKSPVVAGLLSFFFPFIGMLYVRRFPAAALFLVADIIFIPLSLLGVGFVLAFFLRIVAVILATSGVNKIYIRNLDAEIVATTARSAPTQAPVAFDAYRAPIAQPGVASPAAAAEIVTTGGFCGSCGSQLPARVQFCEDCGTPTTF